MQQTAFIDNFRMMMYYHSMFITVNYLQTIFIYAHLFLNTV